MQYLKVEENKNLVRDISSNAILQSNLDELQKHRTRKNMLESKDLKIDELSSRVEQLELLLNKLLNINNE